MLEGRHIDSLIDLFEDEKLKEGIKSAKSLARKKIFKEQRKIELELGAYNIIETLLGVLIRAAYAETQGTLSFRDKRALELMGGDRPDPDMELSDKYRRINDYITGMTDDYARYIAHQLNGMGY
jgi:dGTPase